MDTTTNELQALRKELDALRNENIALYNELTKQNKTLCEHVISLHEQNIALNNEFTRQHAILNHMIHFFGGALSYDNVDKYLTRLAGMQTAEFIVEHMNKLKAYDTREAHLKYALSQAGNDALGGGLYLEFGVFEGNSINLISSTFPDKIIYGFDSFEGLPEVWWQEDKYPKGKFSLKGNLPAVNANVRLVKGWFNETLPEFVKAHPEQCAFIHIDCDLYSSTKIVLDTLKNQIGAGTVIAFDEYFNYPGWKDGEYKAFMEFIAWSGLEFEYIARTNSAQVSVKIK